MHDIHIIRIPPQKKWRKKREHNNFKTITTENFLKWMSNNKPVSGIPKDTEQAKLKKSTISISFSTMENQNLKPQRKTPYL